MNIHKLGCLIAVVLVISHNKGIAQNSVDWANEISSSDPHLRLATITDLAQRMAKANPPILGNDVLPALAKALTDADGKVRLQSSVILVIIASSTCPVLVPPKSGIDLTKSVEIKTALVTAMSDPNPEVRNNAYFTYSLSYKLTPDLEQKIIDDFNHFQPNPVTKEDHRIQMINDLVMDRSPSSVVTDFLVRKVSDPDFGLVAIQAIASLKMPPIKALPILMDEFSKSFDPAKKVALAKAIGAYGSQAQSFNAQLKQALANEKNSEVKTALQNTIDKLH